MFSGEGYGPEADVWACGVCLYTLLSRTYPHVGATVADIYAAIKGAGVAFTAPAWRSVSPPAIDLIRRMLDVDPFSRITTNDILLHPWLLVHAAGTRGPTTIKRAMSFSQGLNLLRRVDVALRGVADDRDRDSKAREAAAPVAAAAHEAPPALTGAALASPGGPPADAQGASGSPPRATPPLLITRTTSIVPIFARESAADPSLATSSGSPTRASASGVSCSSSGPYEIARRRSSRVWLSPEDPTLREKLHAFVDAFKTGVEEAYARVMRARNGEDARKEWASVCEGLTALNECLLRDGHDDGPFFLGHDPSLAEAATAPALFRMMATVRGVRVTCYGGEPSGYQRVFGKA